MPAHHDDDVERDYEWQKKFLPQQQEIAEMAVRARMAPIEDDLRRNTDLILESVMPLKGGPIRVSARVRRAEYRTRYRDEFTIRTRRPSGVATEMHKLLAGDGDLFIYGFESAPGSDRMYPWFMGNLRIADQYIRDGGYKRSRRNKGQQGSHFDVFHLADMPAGFLLNSEGLPDIDRDRPWGGCRNRNWDNPALPQRAGMCNGDYVMPLDDKLQPGNGYWRQCLVCGFRWRAGWVMPLTNDSRAETA